MRPSLVPIQFHVDPRGGRVALRAGRALHVVAHAAIRYRDERGEHSLTSVASGAAGLTEDTARVEFKDRALAAEWWVRRTDDGVRLRLEVTNIGRQAVRLQRLDVLTTASDDVVELGAAAGEVRALVHGWQSWSPVGSRRLSDPEPPPPVGDDYGAKHVPFGEGGLTSAWVTVLQPPREARSPALLVGFVTGADQLAAIHLCADGRIRATAYADEVALGPGEQAHSEELLVAAAEEGIELLAHYAAQVAAAPMPAPEAVPSGWCTWYAFYGQNTDETVRANVERLEQLDLPLDLVVIDDGYQAAIGDWLAASRRYPEGLAATAARIRAGGRRPVLWIAPFGTAVDSQLYRDHPTWVLRDEKGEPVQAWTQLGTPVLALDTTHPEVLGWLGRLFGALAETWDGFKLDYLYAGALPGRRHDAGATRAQAYRRGLAQIRGAVGNRFLLGSGAPLVPSVGKLDAMRVGPDVHPAWTPTPPDATLNPTRPGMENALRAVMGRGAFHGHWWINDPDCVMVRPRGDESLLTPAEVRTAVTVLALSGGMVVNSDNLTTLAPTRVSLLRRLLPPLGTGATTPDLLRRDEPRLFVLPVERTWGAWVLAAVVNWSDQPATLEVDFEELGLAGVSTYLVYEFWSRTFLGRQRRRMTLPRVPAHGTRLLLLKRPTAQPDLLSTTLHIGQGAVEVEDLAWEDGRGARGYLTARVRRPSRQRGSLILSAPAPWRAVAAQVDGAPVGVYNRGDGTARVSLVVNGQATVEVECER